MKKLFIVTYVTSKFKILNLTFKSAIIVACERYRARKIKMIHEPRYQPATTRLFILFHVSMMLKILVKMNENGERLKNKLNLRKMYDLFFTKYINYKTKGFLNFSGFEEFLREIFEINHAKNN